MSATIFSKQGKLLATSCMIAGLSACGGSDGSSGSGEALKLSPDFRLNPTTLDWSAEEGVWFGEARDEAGDMALFGALDREGKLVLVSVRTEAEDTTLWVIESDAGSGTESLPYLAAPVQYGLVLDAYNRSATIGELGIESSGSTLTLNFTQGELGGTEIVMERLQGHFAPQNPQIPIEGAYSAGFFGFGQAVIEEGGFFSGVDDQGCQLAGQLRPFTIAANLYYADYEITTCDLAGDYDGVAVVEVDSSFDETSMLISFIANNEQTGHIEFFERLD